MIIAKNNLVRCIAFLFAAWIILIIAGSKVQGNHAKENLNVLPANASQSQEDEMMRRYLRRLSHEALDQRMLRYEALETAEQIAEYQQKMQEFFITQLGGFPERTPLNARIVDRKEHVDYRLEKVIYESLPRFPVTALFYLPKTEPPYPGVLVPCGHSENGKAAYQHICILLAKNGIAALCYDPIGQGERKQILDEQGQPLYRPTTEHMITGIAPILLGRNIATYMVWDGIRGIDYLVSRPEIDSKRIGCTGNSGGGNMTSYLMALDERIVSAAPSCFITTTRRKNESPGPGDAEQNIHAQTAFGMDHPDYILMRAPRPTLILTATRDFVPIEGSWEAFRQAKRLYARLGYAERVDLVEADEQHGFSHHLRVGSVRWMRRWLLGKDDAIMEGDAFLESDEELQCTPEGQVLLLPNTRSVFDLNIAKEKQLVKERKRFWKHASQEKIREKIRKIAGIHPLQNLPDLKFEKRGTIQCQGYQIEKWILEWERDIQLPALLFQPESSNGEPYLYFHGEGKHVDALPGGAIESLVQAGHTVLAVDLRGCGETRTTPWRYTGATKFTGYNTAEFFIAYMLGKSFVGMRTEDILVSARFLNDTVSNEDKKQVHVIAIGEAGPAALHAVALEPSLFTSLTLQQSLRSWSDAIYTKVTKNVLINNIHGALRFYDLPDLERLIGENRLAVENPVNAQGGVMKIESD